MCQLIVKPAGVVIPENVLRDAWQANDDGAGFAYRDEEQNVMFAKGYFKFKHFYKAYKKIQQHDVLIHFRLATHGEKVTENCHPFVVTNQAVIAHNGILYNYQPSLQDKRSDTRIFVETVLTPAIEKNKLNADDFFSSFSTKALFEAFTQGNKFAALTQKGFYIFNEAAGEWKDKVWYSAGYPPDQNWWKGACYDWRDYLDAKWKRDRQGASMWESELDGLSTTTAGGNHVRKWIQDESTGQIKQLTSRPFERCNICDEMADHLYSMDKDCMVCNQCWETFYG